MPGRWDSRCPPSGQVGNERAERTIAEQRMRNVGWDKHEEKIVCQFVQCLKHGRRCGSGEGANTGFAAQALLPPVSFCRLNCCIHLTYKSFNCVLIATSCCTLQQSRLPAALSSAPTAAPLPHATCSPLLQSVTSTQSWSNKTTRTFRGRRLATQTLMVRHLSLQFCRLSPISLYQRVGAARLY